MRKSDRLCICLLRDRGRVLLCKYGYAISRKRERERERVLKIKDLLFCPVYDNSFPLFLNWAIEF